MLEAEGDAQAPLAKAWTKESPSGFYLPVDPFEIAMNLGIQVFTGRGLSLEISGMLKKEAGFRRWTDLLSPEEQDAEEVYANHFAAELLMPRHIVLDRIGDSNVAALALDFGVSGDAMRFRLEHLDQR